MSMNIDVIFKTNLNTIGDMVKTLSKEVVQPMMLVFPCLETSLEGLEPGQPLYITEENTVTNGIDFVVTNEPIMEENCFYNVAIVEDSFRKTVLFTTTNAMHSLTEKYSSALNVVDYGRTEEDPDRYPDEIVTYLEGLFHPVYEYHLAAINDNGEDEENKKELFVTSFNMDHQSLEVEINERHDTEKNILEVYPSYRIYSTGLRAAKDRIRIYTMFYASGMPVLVPAKDEEVFEADTEIGEMTESVEE